MLKQLFFILFLISISLVLYAQGPPVPNPPQKIELGNLSDVSGLAPYISYVEQADKTIIDPAAVLRGDYGPLRPLAKDEIGFGYSSSLYWLSASTLNNSGEIKNLMLDTNIKYMRPLAIYVVTNDGSVEQILYNDENQVFSERPLQLPKIVIPLSWAPGEEKQLLFAVGAGGGVTLPLELSTIEHLNKKYGDNMAFSTFFAGVLLTLILINLFHFHAGRRLAHFLYAAMEFSILLFVLHSEGYAFQFFWPNSPGWNAHATMVWGLSTNLFAMLFALYFLELKNRAPVFFKLISGLVVFDLLLFLSIPILDPRWINQSGLLISGLGGLVLLIVGCSVSWSGYRPAKYFVAGWVFMGIGSFINGLDSLDLVTMPIPGITVLKLGVLLEALMLSYGLADQLRSLTELAAKSQRELLQSTQKRLQESLERIELEQLNEQTERALQEKELLIARTSHDIRQPIHSLRLALLATSIQNGNPKANEVMNRTLDHMEEVLGNSETQKNAHARVNFSTFGELYEQIGFEFAHLAYERGVDLKVVPSSVELNTPLMPLKRVISNLLTNALHHSKASKILLGMRRRSDAVEMMLLDNGIGIENADPDTAGSGLGLGIVHELCKENGWTMKMLSMRGKGTTFSITIPSSAGT